MMKFFDEAWKSGRKRGKKNDKESRAGAEGEYRRRAIRNRQQQ